MTQQMNVVPFVLLLLPRGSGGSGHPSLALVVMLLLGEREQHHQEPRVANASTAVLPCDGCYEVTGAAPITAALRQRIQEILPVIDQPKLSRDCGPTVTTPAPDGMRDPELRVTQETTIMAPGPRMTTYRLAIALWPRFACLAIADLHHCPASLWFVTGKGEPYLPQGQLACLKYEGEKCPGRTSNYCCNNGD